MTDEKITTTNTGSARSGKASQLFLVRLWPEDTADGEAGWGGKVQHVLTGKAYPFHDWAALSDILQSMLSAEETA